MVVVLESLEHSRQQALRLLPPPRKHECGERAIVVADQHLAAPLRLHLIEQLQCLFPATAYGAGIEGDGVHLLVRPYSSLAHRAHIDERLFPLLA